MSKFKYTEFEKQMNSVLKHQDETLADIHFPSSNETDATIARTETLLRRLGYQPEALKELVPIQQSKKVMVVPTWEELCAEAERHVGTGCELESIFTEEELRSNELAIRQLNEEFNVIHLLDAFDISIAALAGLVGAAVDILLVGVPTKTPEGLKGGPLANYVRDYFDKKFPEEEMQKLANSKVSKVPYDAQDNRHTTIQVEGLSAYYHRLLQLGHDPLLGFIFGVADILTGRMTTIDKAGNIVSQVMENYADRKESDIFAALAKQVIHFKSDVTTSMGLPAPLMSLFNLLQFGSIGEEEQTIAEIVQGMYYEGYDFIHFCSMSIPAMLVEVIVRLGYAIKRIKEGHAVKDSIPLSLNREKHPLPLRPSGHRPARPPDHDPGRARQGQVLLSGQHPHAGHRHPAGQAGHCHGAAGADLAQRPRRAAGASQLLQRICGRAAHPGAAPRRAAHAEQQNRP